MQPWNDVPGFTVRSHSGNTRENEVALPTRAHCNPSLPHHVVKQMCTGVSEMPCAKQPLATAGKRKVIYPRFNETDRRWTSDGIWRQQLPAVFSTLQKYGAAVPDGQVYEFGLFKGASMRMLRGMAPLARARTYGFDSFQGLPDSIDHGERMWHAGQFRADPRASLLRDLDRADAPIQFVAGFFDKSLSQPGLAMQLGMGPARYVDIDVDLYSSTVPILDFMFGNGLMVPGTVVGYDDFWSPSCNAASPATVGPMRNGEGLAHLEAARRFNVTFMCLAGGCRSSEPGQQRTKFAGHCGAFGAIFMVTSLCNRDGRDPAAGFQLSTEEIVSFKRLNPVCKTNWMA